MSLVWTILVTCKQIFLPPLVPGHPLSGLWLVRTFKMAHLDHVTPLKSFPAQDNVKKGLGNLASGVLFSLIPNSPFCGPAPCYRGPLPDLCPSSLRLLQTALSLEHCPPFSTWELPFLSLIPMQMSSPYSIFP